MWKVVESRNTNRFNHAKGAGAFGYFDVTSTELTKYCKAKLFSELGKRTRVAVRLSRTDFDYRSKDCAPGASGFAVKFYCEDGAWDIAGLSLPCFFTNDVKEVWNFFDVARSAPPDDPTFLFDLLARRPAATHFFTLLQAGRSTPDGYKHINGYGIHAYKIVNAEGQAYYVKWHFKTNQGVKNLSFDEAIGVSDRDYATRDLWNSIQNKNFPSWTLEAQIMTYEQARTCPFDPFNPTKVWPHKECPLIEVGRLVLDQNPSDYYREVELLAFSPHRMVAGIYASPDRLLRARLKVYRSENEKRVGGDPELAIGAEINRCPFHRAASASSSSKGEERNERTPEPEPESPIPDVVRASEQDAEEDHFSQATIFYNKVLGPAERGALADNIAFLLALADESVVKGSIDVFARVDIALANGITSKMRRPAHRIKIGLIKTVLKTRDCFTRLFARSKKVGTS